MDTSPDFLFKILLIGDSGVGKTSVLRRFADDAFDGDAFISTIGIDYKLKTIALMGGRTVRLQIWDTAGQERFHTITTSYYRGADGILLVYDVTDANSFDNIANKWLRTVAEYADGGGDDVEKVLVGNKSDVEEKRVVSREKGENLAKEFGLPFVETSAKANVNVDRAFVDLSRMILAKALRNPKPVEEVANLNAESQKKSKCC